MVERIVTEEFAAGQPIGSSAAVVGNVDAVQPRKEHVTDFITQGIPAVGIGIIDTFSSSVGITTPDEIAQSTTEAFGINDYYNAHKEGIRATGDLIGLFLPATAATKLIQGAGKVGQFLGASRKGSIASKMFTSTRIEATHQQLRTADYALAKQATLGQQIVTHTSRKQLADRLKWTRGLDGVKEGLAQETALYATMNSSNTLFPEDFELIDYLAFAGLGVAFNAVPNYLIARAQTFRSANDVAEVAAKSANPAGIGPEEVLNRPGKRAPAFTANARSATALRLAEEDAVTAGETVAQENFNRLALTAEGDQAALLDAMRVDGWALGGFQGERRIKDTGVQAGIAGQKETLLEAAKNDNNVLAGAVTFMSPAEYKEFAPVWKRNISVTERSLAAKKTELELLRDTAPDQFDDISVLSKEIDDLEVRHTELTSMQAQATNEFGERVPASDYLTSGYISPRIQDEQITKWGTQEQAGTKMFSTTEFTAPDSSFKGKMRFSIDANANVYLSADQLKGMRDNRVDVIWKNTGGKAADKKFAEVSQAYPEGVSGQILHDYSQLYHFKTGAEGKRIFETMSQPAKEIVGAWTTSPRSSGLRNLATSTDPAEKALYDEIYSAYAPFRQKLGELADAHDGTINLFRGESKEFIKTGGNDITSFTTSLSTARAFARGHGKKGQIITRRIPIHDIVLPVGGLGQEFEYIVGGNFQRKFGSPQVNTMWPKLPTIAHSVAFDGMKKWADNYVPKGSPNIILDSDSHWTKFALAQEVVRRNPDAISDITLNGKALADIPDELTWYVRRGQFNEWNMIQDQVEQAAKEPFKVAKDGLSNAMTPERVRMMFAFEAPKKSVSMREAGVVADPLMHEGVTPLEQVFHELRMAGDRDLSAAVPGGLPSLQDMVKRQIARTSDSAVLNNLQAPLAANLAGIPTMESVIVLSKNIAFEQLARAEQHMAGVARYDEILSTLLGAEARGSVLVGGLSHIIGTEAFEAAKKVHLINEGSRRGAGIVTTSAFNVRDNITLRAANTVAADAQKVVDNYAGRLYDSPNAFATALKQEASGNVNDIVSHTTVFQRVRSDLTATTEFGTYATARRLGWSVQEEAVQGEDGLWRWVLNHEDTRNQKLFQRRFGRDIEEGEFMPYTASGDPKVVAIRNDAYAATVSFRDIGKQILDEQNVVQKALGQSEIKARAWWMPPKNFSNQEVSYLMDESGNVLRTITGRTKGEVQRKLETQAVKELTESFKKQGREVRIRAQEEVDTWYDLQSKTFFDLQDASDPLVSLGRPAKGTAAGAGIEDGLLALNDGADAILKQTQNISKRALSLMFEPQMNYTKQMHKSFTHDNKFLKQSVWQLYLDTMLGNQAIRRKGFVGDSYRMAEKFYDEGMLQVWERTNGQSLIGLLRGKVSGERKFKAVKEALGDFMPYDKATRFAEEQLGSTTPGTMKEHAAKLNWFTSTMILRLFETAHPVLNMSGVITNMPSITRALTRQDGETVENWRSRIRHFGTEFGTDAEAGIAALNPAKLLTNAAARGFTKEGAKDWAFAANQGYLKQEVAEIQRVISAPHETMVQSIIKKGIDYGSYLSDKSEELARGWSHMAGLQVAESLGITAQREKHSFAHQFANDVIGDYRASNRPAIFQGAAGMPLGLFQTYMWNYYQRVFGYIENGQRRAAAVQVAMQAGIFGAASVPGWDQFSDIVSGAHDDERMPSDFLRDTYGPGVGDFLLNGTLSNIPKIFGQDSIAFYTRGDANAVRIPTYLNTSELPQFSVIRGVYESINGVVDEFRTGGQFSNQRMMELLGTWMPNRPMARMMEVAAGHAIDKRGNVISNDTRDMFSVAVRAMGLRPGVEQAVIEANYQNRQTEASQREIRGRLRDTLTPQIRAGTFDGNSINQAYVDYLKSGGNPRYFARTLRNWAIMAQTPKAQTDLRKYLKSANGIQLQRLMAALDARKVDE